MVMSRNSDDYFLLGCGRCSLGGTPNCKVHHWQAELENLRRILLDFELVEESKWGFPCYTFQKKNLILLSSFKEYCALLFFKGALLKDTAGILVKPGENTQAGRQLRFTDVREILAQETIVKDYIAEAIEVEKAGLKVELKMSKELTLPEEFQNILLARPDLKIAFEALTPGRQRGYIYHFSAPKQAKTRKSRIEKSLSQILKGKGLNESI